MEIDSGNDFRNPAKPAFLKCGAFPAVYHVNNTEYETSTRQTLATTNLSSIG